MAFLDTLVDDMTGAWPGPTLADTRIPMLDGTALRNSYAGGAAQMKVPSFTSIQAAMTGHNQYFVNNWNACVNWLLVYPMQGHASQNACVEVRRMFCQVLKADNTWAFVFVGLPAWGKRVSGGDDASGVVGTQTKLPDGVLRVQPGPSVLLPSETGKGRRGYELWPSDWDGTQNAQPLYGKVDRALFAQAKSIVLGAQVRLALWDANGTDDRAASRFVTQIGCDLYTSPYPGYRYITDTGVKTNTFGDGYPYGVMDANSGRWKVVDSNNWTWVTCSAADDMWGYEADTPPPWGNWTPKWAYNKSPYAITEAAFLANPPLVPPGDPDAEVPPVSGRHAVPTVGNWFDSLSGGSANWTDWAATGAAYASGGVPPVLRRRR